MGPVGTKGLYSHKDVMLGPNSFRDFSLERTCLLESEMQK